MGSKKRTSIALFLILNVVMLNTISSAYGSDKGVARPSTHKPRRGNCKNVVKLRACGDLMRSMLNFTVGNPPKGKCCSVMTGMINFEAAVCVCTALKANLLGATINIPLSISLLLSACSKKVPPEFKCA